MVTFTWRNRGRMSDFLFTFCIAFWCNSLQKLFLHPLIICTYMQSDLNMIYRFNHNNCIFTEAKASVLQTRDLFSNQVKYAYLHKSKLIKMKINFTSVAAWLEFGSYSQILITLQLMVRGCSCCPCVPALCSKLLKSHIASDVFQ